MKVLLYGRYGEYPKEVEGLVKDFDLEIVKKDPEVVISYGGDGTLLGAERDYPGILKLPLRDSESCHLCYDIPNEKLLSMLVRGNLELKEYFKLEARASGKKVLALNDIIIAHKVPNSAIRFEALGKNYVGDGLVIATPFGSTGYFYSVTKTDFASGIGIAFNNLHNSELREKILRDDEEIKVTITRGPAVLTNDNDPNLIEIEENDEVSIKKSTLTAKILSP